MPIRRSILDELSGTVRSMLARKIPERVLFMTGEAGIGKSTLIKQLIADLETDAKPPIVAIAECSTPVAGSGVGHVEALKPFADIMSGLVEAGAESAHKPKKFKLDIGKFFVDTAPSWIGLIPVVGAPIFHALTIAGSGYDQLYLHNKLKTEGASAALNQEQVFRQYINFISKLASEVPVLVILDDFHWADTSSTNLLFAAARDLAACEVVFLVVYRRDDIKRSAQQDEHPIMHVRNEIERYSMSLGIEVPPADRDDIHALIRAQYPEYVVDDVLEKWLLRISDGNLLFATQFLATLEHDRYLEPRSAVLLKDLSTVPIPTSANAVVVEHIRRLNTEDKEHLRYASVEGETITAHMVSRFLDMPMIKMLQRLRVLEEQHHILRSLGKQSLYVKETTAYQFVHFLVHKTLYEDLGEEERSILHGIAADVLEEELAAAEEAEHNVHKVAARLAAHATIAERYQVAAEALLKGAKWVWKSFAADEALYFIEQCRSVVQKHKKPTAQLRNFATEALMLKAEISFHKAIYADASECYREVLGFEDVDTTPAQRSKAHVGLASIMWLGGKHQDAEIEARVSLEISTLHGDTGGRIRALRVVGNTFYSRGMFDQARDFYQQSLDLALSVGDNEGRASAVTNIGNVYGDRGLIEMALQHHREALAIRRTQHDTSGVTRELLNVGLDLINSNLYDEANRALEEALKLARASGALKQEASIMNNLANVRHSLGDYDEALDLAQKSLAIKERIGDRGGVLQSFGTIGNIYASMNRLEQAIDYFSRCMDMAATMNNQVAIARARYAMAYTYLMQNMVDDALPLFEVSTNLFGELGAITSQFDSAYGAACCSLKIESVSKNGSAVYKRHELLERTKTFVGEDRFDIALYNSIQTQENWKKVFHKIGFILED